MLIDFHTHTFADRLCPNAINSLADKAQILPYTDGTMAKTKALMQNSGVDKFVVLNIAVNAHTQKKVNDYAISINSDNVIAFGSVYPFSSDFKDEIIRLKQAGVKGVKFHNEYQNFFIDDEKAFPAYEECIKQGLIIVFHGGKDLGFVAPFKAPPEKMLNVFKTFNYDKFIFAHMGGYEMHLDACKFLADTLVYTDTSFSSSGSMSNELMEKVIDAFTPQRVLFGSDCPWDYPKRIIEHIATLKYSASEKQMIYSDNAKRLLKI